MSDVTRAADPALLVDELSRQFEVARRALAEVGGIARRLQQQAKAAAEAQAGERPRVVRLKCAVPLDPVTGQPIQRGRGRPRGAPNHLTLIATPDQIETLRVQLAQK